MNRDAKPCLSVFVAKSSAVGSRLIYSTEDLYYTHYRLWELTKLEDLIREEKDLQKSVIVDGVNQSVAQGYSFAKLWKVSSLQFVHHLIYLHLHMERVIFIKVR